MKRTAKKIAKPAPKTKSKARPARTRPAPSKTVKRINFALQGGGSHGAYAWGILDRFLEDDRISIEGISGCSAGSFNAVVYADGFIEGGVEGARKQLAQFWKALADTGTGFPTPEAFKMFKSMTGSFSPYQWNPLQWNPMRDTLEHLVDFERLRQSDATKLFLAATNVNSGKPRIFTNPEITADVVMASACLPFLFQAVEIEGESYWDGGFMGNPALYPLFYHTESRDVVILHINPIARADTPRLAHEIENRLNEITFNAALIKEMRAIVFVQKLLEDGWIKPEFEGQLKGVLIHSIRADKALRDLSVASKFSLEWSFLKNLFERGRAAGGAWLDEHYDDLGKRTSVDLRAEFL